MDDRFVIIYMPLPVGIALGALLVVEVGIWFTKIQDSIRDARHQKRVRQIVAGATVTLPEQEYRTVEAAAHEAIEENLKKD